MPGAITIRAASSTSASTASGAAPFAFSCGCPHWGQRLLSGPLRSDSIADLATRDPNCRFCQIIAGDEPAHVVFEDERTIAFLDNRPLFPGHSLLVPRDHHETLGDLPGRAGRPALRERPAALRRGARRRCGSRAPSSPSTTWSARACRTCTSTWSRASRRTGCAASSGRAPSTPQRPRCGRSPSGVRRAVDGAT